MKENHIRKVRKSEKRKVKNIRKNIRIRKLAEIPLITSALIRVKFMRC